MTKAEEFAKRLLETFRIEAREHLDGITSSILEMEQSASADSASLSEKILRIAHSLKGASRAVSLNDVAYVCQRFEDVFTLVRKGDVHLSRDDFNILHGTIKDIESLVFSTSTDTVPDADEINSRLSLIIEKNEGKESSEMVPKKETKPVKPPVETPEPPTLQANTIRLSVNKLNVLLLKSEELISSKLIYTRTADEIGDLLKNINKQSPVEIESRLRTLWKSTEESRRGFNSLVDSILEDTKNMMLLPFSELFSILPKLIRDLSGDLDKTVDLKISGDNIQIDRRILEELKDPLIHMVRNAIDHGIEYPDIRVKSGKAESGKINININQRESNRIEFIFEDDGAGIDLDSLKETLVRQNMIKKEDLKSYSEEQLYFMLFASGISTSRTITDISGRGLGLAIVKEKIEKLGGTLSIRSEKGKGTTFVFILPLSFANFRGLLVKSGENCYIIPVLHVEKVLRITPDAIRSVQNKEIITINDEPVSYISLNELFNIPKEAADEKGQLPVILLSAGDKKLAVGVDEIINEQEILIKNLGRHLKKVQNFSGAAILAGGKTIPVLNIFDIINSAVNRKGIPKKAPPLKQKAKKQSILVAEDSITARTLIKNILETAGYKVKTAFDGLDAITTLHTEEFELLISDVEMPRLNGFELASKVRQDPKLKDLPVILITSLGSREDKEKGIDAGANAYIVKSNFDQSNLLETVRRFI